MGILYEDAVLIKEGDKEGNETVITVNCPDKTGLGCDLCRIILLFGLSISRGDISTDGKWCYLVFWVVGNSTTSTRWSLLKKRLLEVCPPLVSEIYYYRAEFQQPKPPDVFLLKFLCYYDRKGLLHDVTKVLCELELTIKRVKVSTTPDGRVMDLFFVTDTRELLHTEERQKETRAHLKAVLVDALISFEIEVVAGSSLQLGSSFLPQDMFIIKPPTTPLLSDSVSVTFDNYLSPSHTLIQIHCQDHKGLIYDIMRTLKDYNIQISYGRFSANAKGKCEMDLFVMQQVDGKKIFEEDKQKLLSCRLKMELVHPLRVDVASRGPDTELLVANPVELSGRGRPLVFHDITLALKIMDTHIFSVEIGRHRIKDREWEVYRVLLEEGGDGDGFCLPRNEIKECVTNRLMGWD